MKISTGVFIDDHFCKLTLISFSCFIFFEISI